MIIYCWPLTRNQVSPMDTIESPTNSMATVMDDSSTESNITLGSSLSSFSDDVTGIFIPSNN